MDSQGRVFISYRHTDAFVAHRLAEKLAERLTGHLFIDLKIQQDDFAEALLSEVRACHVFMLVVTPSTFIASRIQQPDDWIRCELGLALRLQKPIMLAQCDGRHVPPASELPPDLRGVASKQGIDLYPAYFDAGVERLAAQAVAISGEVLALRERRVAAAPAPLPRLPRFTEPMPTIPRKAATDSAQSWISQLVRRLFTKP
jgi:TIR domain